MFGLVVSNTRNDGLCCRWGGVDAEDGKEAEGGGREAMEVSVPTFTPVTPLRSSEKVFSSKVGPDDGRPGAADGGIK